MRQTCLLDRLPYHNIRTYRNANPALKKAAQSKAKLSHEIFHCFFKIPILPHLSIACNTIFIT